MEIRDTRNGSWFWVNTAVNACPHISAHDKVVYNALCTFAGCEEIRPTYDLIAQRAAVSVRTAKSSIETLQAVGYINITGHGKKGVSNVYTLLKAADGCKKCTARTTSEKCTPRPEEVQTTTKSSAPRAPQIDNEVDKEKDTPEQSSEGNAINQLISFFEELNPSYGLFFKRPPQRAAAERLLKLHALNWWQQFIPKYRGQLETDRYCPRAITPIELEEKIGKIELYAKSKKAESLKARANVII